MMTKILMAANNLKKNMYICNVISNMHEYEETSLA